MKSVGIVLVVIGGLMTLSGINLALTQYDMSSSHDVSKAAGGIGVSIGILVAGLVLYRRGKRRHSQGKD